MVSHFQISCQSQLGRYQVRTLGTPCMHTSLPCSQNLPHPTCLLTQPSSPPPPPNLTSPLLPLSLLTAKLSKLCIFVLPSNAFAETVESKTNWCRACSTNMAIGDAGKLGSAITKHRGNLDAALQEYQEERMAQTAKEVGVLDLPKTLLTLLRPGDSVTSLAVCIYSFCCSSGSCHLYLWYHQPCCGPAVTHSLHMRAMFACTAHVHTLLQSLAVLYCPHGY